MSKATIVKVWQEKEVETKNWIRWKYPLELSDGLKKRSSLQDKQNPFKEGMEIEYEFKEEDKYPEIRVKRPRRGGWINITTDYSKEKVLKAMEYASMITKDKGDNKVLWETADFILSRFTSRWL